MTAVINTINNKKVIFINMFVKGAYNPCVADEYIPCY